MSDSNAEWKIDKADTLGRLDAYRREPVKPDKITTQAAEEKADINDSSYRRVNDQWDKARSFDTYKDTTLRNAFLARAVDLHGTYIYHETEESIGSA